MPGPHLAPLLALLLTLPAGMPVAAAPFVPASDAQVLATVPARATDPRARELMAIHRKNLDLINIGAYPAGSSTAQRSG